MQLRGVLTCITNIQKLSVDHYIMHTSTHAQSVDVYTLVQLAGFDMFEKEVEIDGERIKMYLWFVMCCNS